MQELTELKNLVIQSLEANGSLAKIRAQIRASVFNVVEQQEGNPKKPSPFFWENNKAQSIYELANGKDMLEVIKEFLLFYEMHYTNSIFSSESNLREDINREQIAQKLGIEANDPTKPLLFYLLRGGKPEKKSEEKPQKHAQPSPKDMQRDFQKQENLKKFEELRRLEEQKEKEQLKRQQEEQRKQLEEQQRKQDELRKEEQRKRQAHQEEQKRAEEARKAEQHKQEQQKQEQQRQEQLRQEQQRQEQQRQEQLKQEKQKQEKLKQEQERQKQEQERQKQLQEQEKQRLEQQKLDQQKAQAAKGFPPQRGHGEQRPEQHAQGMNQPKQKKDMYEDEKFDDYQEELEEQLQEEDLRDSQLHGQGFGESDEYMNQSQSQGIDMTVDSAALEEYDYYEDCEEVD